MNMENQYKILVFTSLILFSLQHNAVKAQSITVRNDWDLSIGYSDLASPPVSDLKSTYKSKIRQTRIRIRRARNKFWEVSISMSPDADWPGDFHLYAKRTRDGRGREYVEGGESFQEITQIDNYFFDGFLNRRRMWVQYRLTGVSIKIPSGTYSTTITYTVIET
ncbi:hypothetical protein J7K93_02100 [bacterium]|nr:hypothetical protein [bacterium]